MAQISWIIGVLMISCDDYLDIEPVGLVIPKSVEEYRSFLTAAYSFPKQHKILTTYRADEITLNGDELGVDQYQDIYTWNDLNPNLNTIDFPYAVFYTVIFYTNHVIQNEKEITGDQEDIDQLVGEAYALRALQYFDLVNLYGKPYDESNAISDEGVPIVTEYDSERRFAKESIEEVYKLIISDIEESEKRLNIEQQEIGFNYRFSLVAIKSFKARVFLFQKKWQQSIDLALEALAIKPDLMDLNVDESIMSSEYNSIESILALDLVVSLDIIQNAHVSDELITNYDQLEDKRFSNYFKENSDGNYSSKKGTLDNFKCTFRTAELYMILAESYARLGGDQNLNLSKGYLYQLLENRYTPAGLEAYKNRVEPLNADDLIQEILIERQREFALEGHRWNDLRRTTQKKITRLFDGTTYVLEQNDERYTLPFPQDAIINNPDL
ncbi:RagB/SusD family nutrient uptake outer membrane protein [Reichenbachiella versicolor]|uniref:RagB/SusD family nutrient uptake outer membrane protein n=1 Tax=Reichenbachiella versicolor TaxID=1821036 RepID=UPI001C872B1E|nr:RagB/SusD family nutrient uptake outer membrane protein [Reichenbachiella versicolor]